MPSDHDHTYSTNDESGAGGQQEEGRANGEVNGAGEAPEGAAVVPRDPRTPGGSSSASGTDGEPGGLGQRQNSDLVLLQRHINHMQVKTHKKPRPFDRF